MTELDACIALNMIPGMGPIRLRRLLQACGSAVQVLHASPSDLRSVEGVGFEVAAAIRRWERTIDLAAELRRIAEHGFDVLSWDSPNYPPSLVATNDPPIVLYVRGGIEERDARGIGIVGTRKPSAYAAECARKLSYQLAYAGLTVVSGLARGVDTEAHKAAIAARGRTIAVLGSGLLRMYPRENGELADRIADAGAVISEFPLTVMADRQTFPMRNRIIAGMTFGLLVVEAGVQSGAMITASQAGELGRTLYAVPGRIDQPGSVGGNQLIQQGAKLVVSAQDILDDLGLLFRETPAVQRPAPSLDGEESVVYAAITNDSPGVDQIIRHTGLGAAITHATLFRLELKHLVKQLPGQRYVKTE